MFNTTGNSTNSTLGSTEDLSQLFSAIKASNFINLFLGLPTNGYVLWLIVSGVGGTTQSEFFALNLTVSELLFCVYNILYLISLYHPAMPIQAAKFFSGMLYFARPLFQTCICLERYLAVVHPVVFLRYKPLRYRLACCSVVWLLITSMCLFFVFGDLDSLLSVYFGLNLVMLLVQLFSCLSVLWVLRQSGPGEGGGSSNIKLRAFKIILLILITMLLTYIPFVIAIGLHLFSCSSVQQGVLIFSITFCIAIICGFTQPLLFLHRTGKLPCLNMAA